MIKREDLWSKYWAIMKDQDGKDGYKAGLTVELIPSVSRELDSYRLLEANSSDSKERERCQNIIYDLDKLLFLCGDWWTCKGQNGFQKNHPGESGSEYEALGILKKTNPELFQDGTSEAVEKIHVYALAQEPTEVRPMDGVEGQDNKLSRARALIPTLNAKGRHYVNAWIYREENGCTVDELATHLNKGKRTAEGYLTEAKRLIDPSS